MEIHPLAARKKTGAPGGKRQRRRLRVGNTDQILGGPAAQIRPPPMAARWLAGLGLLAAVHVFAFEAGATWQGHGGQGHGRWSFQRRRADLVRRNVAINWGSWQEGSTWEDEERPVEICYLEEDEAVGDSLYISECEVREKEALSKEDQLKVRRWHH